MQIFHILKHLVYGIVSNSVMFLVLIELNLYVITPYNEQLT